MKWVLGKPEIPTNSSCESRIRSVFTEILVPQNRAKFFLGSWSADFFHILFFDASKVLKSGRFFRLSENWDRERMHHCDDFRVLQKSRLAPQNRAKFFLGSWSPDFFHILFFDASEVLKSGSFFGLSEIRARERMHHCDDFLCKNQVRFFRFAIYKNPGISTTLNALHSVLEPTVLYGHIWRKILTLCHRFIAPLIFVFSKYR